MSADVPDADNAHADVGIVCALPIEIGAFLDRFERISKNSGGDLVFRGGRYDELRVAVVESGVGFALARRATQALIDAHTPQWIISAGFAGALQPHMKTGDIVVADAVADTHGNELNVDLKMSPTGQGGLHVGRIVTTDEVVRTVEAKRELNSRFHAIAVDLESLAVAQVCSQTKTPFLAVRAITDDMSADLPPEILSLVGTTGTVRLGAAIGAAWKRKGSIKEMWRLRESAHKAAEQLANFLDGVVKQLHAARR
jgi:adenosylhomocysteine nucleosidase